MAKRNSPGGSSGRRGSSRNSSVGSSSGGRKSGGGKSFRKSDSRSSDDAPKRSSSRSYGGSSQGKSSYGDKKPFKSRDNDSSPRGKSSYRGNESSGPRKSYRKSDSEGGERFKKFDKPYGKRDGGSSSGSERSFGNKRGGFRKEGDSESRGRSSYGDKRESSSRPRKTSYRKSDSEGGDRKDFKQFDKPFEKKSEGSFDSRRPRRNSGSSFRDKRTDENTGEEGRAIRKSRFDKFSGDDRTERPSRGRSSSSDEPRGFFKKSKTRYDAKPDRKSQDIEAPVQTEKMRLNRFIANSGVCSRREADELISMGLISVNGKTVTEMGYKVNPGDVVRYENKILKAEKPVYVLMNKPKGFLTTTDDPQERNTVMHIIGSNVKERIYPVGRLDRNTTGLLLLTNDGDLADKLMHPSYNVKKIYKVELDRPITKADLQAIMDGVILEEGRALVDDVAIVSEDGKTVGVEIHIGWNRVVRRIFESFGYEVVKLDRSVYAGLDKKDLGRGQWRFLTREEITRLKHFK
ncbi:MAG TPA: pseudouridine synthase [Chryseosolibacter sp.]